MGIPWRAALLLALGAPGVSAGEVRVEVRRDADRSYSVKGAFVVKASTAAVWAVLTDYDHIGGYVSAMKRSRFVESRVDGAVVVEQEATGGAFVFFRRVRVILEIRGEPGRLSFIDVGREDFWEYNGFWAIAPSGPGESEVVYRLNALPDFTVPPILMRSRLRKGARELLEQVRTEIVRRESQ